MMNLSISYSSRANIARALFRVLPSCRRLQLQGRRLQTCPNPKFFALISYHRVPSNATCSPHSTLFDLCCHNGKIALPRPDRVRYTYSRLHHSVNSAIVFSGVTLYPVPQPNKGRSCPFPMLLQLPYWILPLYSLGIPQKCH